MITPPTQLRTLEALKGVENKKRYGFKIENVKPDDNTQVQNIYFIMHWKQQLKQAWVGKIKKGFNERIKIV